MKNYLLILIFSLCLSACSEDTGPIISTNPPTNYVVLLDLSDRIIQTKDQVDIDTNAILSVIDKFEEDVRASLVIKSMDKFAIRIIPQENSPLDGGRFEDELCLDLSKYSPAEKLKKLKQFKGELPGKLKLLYQKAKLGNKSNSYNGVDIWKYFNEQINSDLDRTYENKVLILTDGYFDFEDENHGLRNNSSATTTGPLLKMMKDVNWRSDAEKEQPALIPVKLNVSAKWIVCGIQPKSGCKDILEAEKLSFLWENWLKNSGTNNSPSLIMNTSGEKVSALISKLL